MVMPNFQREPVPPPPVPVTKGNTPDQPPGAPPEGQESPEQTSELPGPQPEPESSRTTIRCQNSSMVHSFEYNDKDRTLRVYFRGGQIYDYFFVPENIADEFRRVCEDPAESAGKWFARVVRKTFEYQKVA